MKIRTLLIAAGLVTLAGCAVGPYWDDEGVYGPGYPIYRDTDSYDGYYYVQIIYIDGEPWYVDDYRRAHPIPPNLRSHFRNPSWVRSLPPRFGRDDDVRDGYRLSRIVYVNDVPVYVDDDRRARPLPERERSRFSYQGVVTPRDAGRGVDERRPFPPATEPRYNNAPRAMPPAFGREPERSQPPAYGREPERPQAPAYGGEREMPPANGRMQERQPPTDYGRERERQGAPSYGSQPAPRPQPMPERVREAPQGRPAPPAVRDGRGEPAGRPMTPPSDRGTGMGRPVPQESGSKANDGQRGGAAERKNGKATGRGTGRDDGGQDGGSVRGNRPGE